MPSAGKSEKFSSLDELFPNLVEIKDWSEAPTNTEIISTSALSLKVEAKTLAEKKSPENVAPMEKSFSLPDFKRSFGFSRNRLPFSSARSSYGSANNFPSSSSVNNSPKQLLPSLRDPPFYVYVTNITFRATKADVFYFFGGKDCIKHIHMYQTDNGFAGDCFIEVVDRREVFQEMLRKDREELLNRRVFVFAVDPKNGHKWRASFFCSQFTQMPSVERNYSSTREARRTSQNYGPENKSARDKKYTNNVPKCDVFATPPAKDRPPQLKLNSNPFGKKDLSSIKRVDKKRKVFEFPQMARALPPKEDTVVIGGKERS